MKRSSIFLLMPLTLAAVQIPSGTELSIRLTDKIATETAAAHTAVHAVLMMPVMVDGKQALPLGTTITGEVTSAKAATDSTAASLLLTFNHIGNAKMTAAVSGIDNARETVGTDGTINGINGAETYGGRLDQGITKLKASDRLGALGGILDATRQALKIQAVNANIDYDAGTELTLKLTAPLDWRGPVIGPEAKLQPVANLQALTDLVNRQPWRTQTAEGAKPSDITSLMFIGAEADIKAAFDKAGWSGAARLSSQSKLETARALIEDRGYKEGPMSVLMLEGQAPSMMLQKGNNTFAARHHLRVFNRPDQFAGKPVWVVSATHDTGIDFSERNRTFIHKIDSNVDLERAKIVNDLLYTGLVKSLVLVDRPDLPSGLTNATGDAIKSDNRMAVLIF